MRGAAGLTPRVHPKEHVEVEAEDLSQQVPEQQVLQARTDSPGERQWALEDQQCESKTQGREKEQEIDFGVRHTWAQVSAQSAA